MIEFAILATTFQILFVDGFEVLLSLFGILIISCGSRKSDKLPFEVARWAGVSPRLIFILVMIIMWGVALFMVFGNLIYFVSILNPADDASNAVDRAPKWAAIVGLVFTALAALFAMGIPCCCCRICTENDELGGLMARNIWFVYKILAFTIPGLLVGSAAGDIRALGWGVHLILDAVNWFVVLTMDDN